METWQLSPEQLEARSRSNSGTPKPNGTKTFKVKFTQAEYNRWKETGVRPVSQRATASPTPDTQSQAANSNSVNADSLSAELEHVLSAEAAAGRKKNGAKPGMAASKELEKFVSPTQLNMR